MKNKKYLYTYRIADIVFSIFSKNEIRTTENFFPFIYQGEKKDFIIQLEEKESMPFEMNNVLFENYIFKAGKDKEGYYRIFCDHKENNRPYAQSRIYDNGMEEICYLKEFQNSFSESQNTFSHIGFEELLIRKNAIVLHASLIESEYGGILFTEPSGIGKSTQADMWAKYEKVEILNGDRPILKKENENWKAYGSPYAGSSDYYVNKSTNVKAIIVLEQSKTCSIERLKNSRAFLKLYSGMIVNTWRPDFVERVVDLTKDLIEQVPVYLLKCTPDYEAVKMLKSVLERE